MVIAKRSQGRDYLGSPLCWKNTIVMYF